MAGNSPLCTFVYSSLIFPSKAEQGHLLALKPHAAHLRAGVEAGEMVVEVHEAHIMWRGR